MAKALIAAAYGKRPDRSYFGGCSNGGRHTLVAADALCPRSTTATWPVHRASACRWRPSPASLVPSNTRRSRRPTTPPTSAPPSPRPSARLCLAAVLAKCDALDGATDGLVQDTHACQAAFDFNRDVPTCSGARDGSCLTAAQKAAIAPIFSRRRRPATAHTFYASFPFDSGHGSGRLAFWEFIVPLMLDSGAVGDDLRACRRQSRRPSNGPAFALDLAIDAMLARRSAPPTAPTPSPPSPS